MKELQIKSSLDGTLQPSLFYHPQTDAAVPLVVGLHTWSYDRFNQRDTYLPLAYRFGCALLLPEFRGPNLASNPSKKSACGSRLARQDVIDAVLHVCRESSIDRQNIFLLGCSGGGQAALLTAENAPELFRAVDVWCPVTDLAAWYRHLVATDQHYYHDMDACLGRDPEAFPEEYVARSPIGNFAKLKNMAVSIHHGRHDTLIPYKHSADFVSKLEALGNDHVYFDVFDGEHEQFPSHSFEWFARLGGWLDAAVGITG